jgi:hypothetical protein
MKDKTDPIEAAAILFAMLVFAVFLALWPSSCLRAVTPTPTPTARGMEVLFIKSVGPSGNKLAQVLMLKENSGNHDTNWSPKELGEEETEKGQDLRVRVVTVWNDIIDRLLSYPGYRMEYATVDNTGNPGSIELEATPTVTPTPTPTS